MLPLLCHLDFEHGPEAGWESRITFEREPEKALQSVRGKISAQRKGCHEAGNAPTAIGKDPGVSGGQGMTLTIFSAPFNLLVSFKSVDIGNT